MLFVKLARVIRQTQNFCKGLKTKTTCLLTNSLPQVRGELARAAALLMLMMRQPSECLRS